MERLADIWHAQVPGLVAKFDSSGDGEVSLREFFKFLGVAADYAPNILQKMTKVFAVASQKGLSIKGVFAELDKDGNGSIDYDEFVQGVCDFILKKRTSTDYQSEGYKTRTASVASQQVDLLCVLVQLSLFGMSHINYVLFLPFEHVNNFSQITPNDKTTT